MHAQHILHTLWHACVALTTGGSHRASPPPPPPPPLFPPTPASRYDAGASTRSFIQPPLSQRTCARSHPSSTSAATRRPPTTSAPCAMHARMHDHIGASTRMPAAQSNAHWPTAPCATAHSCSCPLQLARHITRHITRRSNIRQSKTRTAPAATACSTTSLRRPSCSCISLQS